jgi:hypothetical protein
MLDTITFLHTSTTGTELSRFILDRTYVTLPLGVLAKRPKERFPPEDTF